MTSGGYGHSIHALFGDNEILEINARIEKEKPDCERKPLKV
jgi:hypothetical protein